MRKIIVAAFISIDGVIQGQVTQTKTDRTGSTWVAGMCRHSTRSSRRGCAN
jgi:hypothetical protein